MHGVHHVGELLIMAERLALALEKLAKGGQLDQCLDVLEKATSEEEERTSTLLPGGQRKKVEKPIVYCASVLYKCKHLLIY